MGVGDDVDGGYCAGDFAVLGAGELRLACCAGLFGRGCSLVHCVGVKVCGLAVYLDFWENDVAAVDGGGEEVFFFGEHLVCLVGGLAPTRELGTVVCFADFAVVELQYKCVVLVAYYFCDFHVVWDLWRLV